MSTPGVSDRHRATRTRRSHRRRRAPHLHLGQTRAAAPDSGLTTNVVFVTAEQSEAAHQRLLGHGQNCYEELGGIRCVAEPAREPKASPAKSHFLRDGIWLATHYRERRARMATPTTWSAPSGPALSQHLPRPAGLCCAHNPPGGPRSGRPHARSWNTDHHARPEWVLLILGGIVTVLVVVAAVWVLSRTLAGEHP